MGCPMSTPRGNTGANLMAINGVGDLIYRGTDRRTGHSVFETSDRRLITVAMVSSVHWGDVVVRRWI